MPSSPPELSPLTAVSAIDGRYAEKTAPLRELFSEYALMRRRVHVEVEWLKYLAACDAIPEATALSAQAQAAADRVADEFDPAQAAAVKRLEATLNHDVKAVEYYLREKFKENRELTGITHFLHFALTSEDVSNLAWGLMLKQARDGLVLPRLQAVHERFVRTAEAWADAPLLARTHGQPASPTTVGKEFMNFAHRLRGQTRSLAGVEIAGKFSGAVGNFNAHHAAYPDLDWPDLAEKFVSSLELAYAPCTAQIEPHDRLAELLDALARVNRILLDFCRDAWGYVALGHFAQKIDEDEVGSSTMPHKVNPIDFENAEGNFGLSTAVAQHLSSKLPVSRWQRDLSDSTVLRSLGAVFAHFLIALDSLERGLDKIEVAPNSTAGELDAHWEVLGEALQTVLRKHGVADAYERLKESTRGRRVEAKDWRRMVESSPLSDGEKQRLLKLTPATYTGLAQRLARR